MRTTSHMRLNPENPQPEERTTQGTHTEDAQTQRPTYRLGMPPCGGMLEAGGLTLYM